MFKPSWFLPRRSGKHQPAPGRVSVGSGFASVAELEAGIADVLVTGNSLGTDDSRFERVIRGAGPRQTLASAMGASLCGQRTSVFLTGDELEAGLDLLEKAVEQGLPLLVHVALDDDHRILHAAAQTGAVVLVATDVQEAVDLSLVARKTAEASLTPVVVAQDGRETAWSLRNVSLPGSAGDFLGAPTDTIHSPYLSHELAWGRHRRRVPRHLDPGQPQLSGALPDTRSAMLGHAARFAYSHSQSRAALQGALGEMEERIGRGYRTLRQHRVEDAEMVLLAMGSVVETAEAVADVVRARRGPKVGVIGIRALGPFPDAELVSLLDGKKVVSVLERTIPGAGAESPLTLRVRSVLGRASQNGSRKKGSGLPLLRQKDLPPVISVFHGLGGFPTRAEDLAGLCRELIRSPRGPIFLGVDFRPSSTAFPKRQVLLDALERHHPEARRFGLRSTKPIPSLLPKGSVRVGFHRWSSGQHQGMVEEIARILHRRQGGQVRVLPERSALGSRVLLEDHLIFGPEPLGHPGDQAPEDAVIWLGPGPPPATLARRIRSGGALLLSRRSGVSFFETLPAELKTHILEKSLHVHLIEAASGSTRREAWLGRILGMFVAEEWIESGMDAVIRAYRELLEETEGIDIEERATGLEEGWRSRLTLDTAGLTTSPPAAEPEREPPLSVRNLSRGEGGHADLADFHDRIGILYERGAHEELSPDPALVAGVLPPMSAVFAAPVAGRAVIPVFDPASCTGCGRCWTECPDDAVAVRVLSMKSLLEAGMQRAKEQGRSTDALRMVLSKLSTVGAQTVAQADPPQTSLSTILEQTLNEFLETAKLPEARIQPVTDAFDAVRETLGDLPVSRTEAFFDTASAKGGLLTLAIDPDACKGCGICVSACETDALTAGDSDPLDTDRCRRIESLPATAADLVARAREHPEVGRLPAAMLGGTAPWMVAGDGAEPGSGARIALRQILGAAAPGLNAARETLVGRVEELRDQLSERVRERLAGALPTRDLDALAEGLGALQRPDVDLAELSTRMENAFDSSRVDTRTMRRLVECAREVGDLYWRLTVGKSGLGRAPFVVVADPSAGADWLGTFPHNPFGVPVLLQGDGMTPALARGVWMGQARAFLDEMSILRRAERELQPAGRAGASADSGSLTFDDLTPEELAVAPVLFVVVPSSTLQGSGLSGLIDLVSVRAPIKVIALAEKDWGVGSVTESVTPSESPGIHADHLGLIALAHPQLFALQTAIGHPDHLADGVARALLYDGPALLQVRSPSPLREGFSPEETVIRSQQSVESGAYPLLAVEPDSGERRTETMNLLRRLFGGEPATDGKTLAGPQELQTRIRELEEEVANLHRDQDRRLLEAGALAQAEMKGRIQNRLRALLGKPSEAAGTRGDNGS